MIDLRALAHHVGEESHTIPTEVTRELEVAWHRCGGRKAAACLTVAYPTNVVP
jgi:hypothetical protein